jgi:hydroxyethylthiazole kinase
MYDRKLATRAGRNLEALRAEKPLIHNITNYVAMNYTANALLASGASPVMTFAHEEVEEMVSLAAALALNIGTLTPYSYESMLKAGKRANALNLPVVLDPVGSGSTRHRTESAKRLMQELSIDVIRGNASEVLSLAAEASKTKGVDAIHSADEAADAGIVLARNSNTTLVITGEVDLVTDGQRILYVHNGHGLMGTVTGTGCTAAALIAAFMAVDPDAVMASATGLAYFGLAGEHAADRASAPGGFQIAMLDALYTMDSGLLVEGAKIQS